MSGLSRRTFLVASAFGAGTWALARTNGVAEALAQSGPSFLRAEGRVIEVNRKAAKVFGLIRPDGGHGLSLRAGERFRVRLENRIGAPTLVHWHGLLPPYGQDGVPDLPQPVLPAGQAYDYDFALETPGTHWMHAHTLQEQQLLAAPLIVADPGEAALDEQAVVVLFHDFSFKSPEELLAGLRGGAGGMAGHGMGGGASKSATPRHAMGAASKGAGGAGGMAKDLNDIEYDAYLAEDRTLDDPKVFRVERGGVVRLRLINGATATAFWIDLGALAGEAIAVDGNPVMPVAGSRFPLGMGQRIDIRIVLPKGEGAWPILALREGARERTGFVLATKNAAVARLASTAESPSPPLDLALEAKLVARRSPGTKPAARREAVVLGGDMAGYAWTLDGRTWGGHRPVEVRAGERVELTLRNRSMMGHPMHLHGHHFQVTAIDGRPIAGAVRDTVWVPPMRAVTLAFQADNPGQWAFHCHHLYHMAAGMMTTVVYRA